MSGAARYVRLFQAIAGVGWVTLGYLIVTTHPAELMSGSLPPSFADAAGRAGWWMFPLGAMLLVTSVRYIPPAKYVGGVLSLYWVLGLIGLYATSNSGSVALSPLLVWQLALAALTVAISTVDFLVLRRNAR